MAMNFVSYGNMTDLMTAIAGDITSTQGMIAPPFSASMAYAAGDIVTYGDVVYKFTAAHPAGAWTGSDATATTATQLIDAAGVTPLSTTEVNTLIGLLD